MVGVDGLVPIDLVGDGARLVLQLLHHRLHSLEVLGLGPLLVHAGDEVAGADVVEVVVKNIVAADAAVGVDHRVGIFLTVTANVLATIFKVGVEHALQFDTHDVAPLGLLREVQKIGLRRALHLRVGHPLRVVLVGLLRQAERAVHEEVLVTDVAGPAGNLVALGHMIELAVADVDVANVADGVETDNQHAISGLVAGNVVDVDVAHGRVETSAADFVVLVVEVNLDDSLAALSHLDVAHVDVLDDAAATGVCLDAQHAVQIGRIHHAVVGKDVLAAAANLRADHHASMSVVHRAVADDDVLRGHVAFASVAVASALDGYAVVARVEEAVLYQHAVAALGVAAVAVRSVVYHLDAAHGDVGRV